MSEYQYYEFKAIDKPLSQKQQDELGDISSRAEITETSFTNEYNFGDFKGNPLKMMEKYFDAFMYYANWGSRILMLKVPIKMLNWELVSGYCCCESNAVYSKGTSAIFEFALHTDDYDDFDNWMLSSLISLRNDIMQGDYRCLYLGWLNGVQSNEFSEEEPEPPIPAGLNNLSGALKEFMRFLEIDDRLVKSAAALSPESSENIDNKQLLTWVKKLPVAKKDKIIADFILSKKPHLKDELISDYKAKTKKDSQPNHPGRLVGDLLIEIEY